MSAIKVTKESLQAIAALSGLKLSDEKLEELLPQARRIAEAAVLRVAHAYEQATDWHTRRPPDFNQS
jgi:predicted P-loop ATPase/GTPase